MYVWVLNSIDSTKIEKQAKGVLKYFVSACKISFYYRILLPKGTALLEFDARVMGS